MRIASVVFPGLIFSRQKYFVKVSSSVDYHMNKHQPKFSFMNRKYRLSINVIVGALILIVRTPLIIGSISTADSDLQKGNTEASHSSRDFATQ